MPLPFGYQLYSSRNFGPLGQTLEMLAGIGFASVEGYPDNLDDVEDLAADLKRFGLKMRSIHIGLDGLENRLDDIRRKISLLEVGAVFCPYLDEENRPVDAEGWSDFGGRLQGLSERFAADGTVFGWHNHDFEFRPLEDGSIAMDHIFSAAPDIAWEADIAWIAKSGADPFDWIRRYGTRIAAIHVKDIAPEGTNLDEDGWADIGHGTIDWPALIAALKCCPVTHWIAEHDNPSDDNRFARRSFQSFRNWTEAAS